MNYDIKYGAYCEKCGTTHIMYINEDDFQTMLHDGKIEIISPRSMPREISEYNVYYGYENDDSDYTRNLHRQSLFEFMPDLGPEPPLFDYEKGYEYHDLFLATDIFKEMVNDKDSLEKLRFYKTPKCTVCNSDLCLFGYGNYDKKRERVYLSDIQKNNDFFFVNSSPLLINKKFEEIFDTYDSRKEISDYSELCKNKYKYTKIEAFDKEKVDLKQYVNHLINIESAIRYYSTELYNFIINQKKVSRLARYERYSGLQLKTTEQNKKLSDIDKLIAALNDSVSVKDISPADLGLTPPKRTIIQKAVIEPPQYKIPHFFNRSKVLAENARLQKQYSNQLEKAAKDYERALLESNLKYEKAVYEYKQKFEQLKQEYYSKKNTEIEQIKQQVEAKKQKLQVEKDAINAEIASIEEEFISSISNNKIQQLNNILLSEITEIKNAIEKLYQIKYNYENTGVVYPKYLNFVALTTMSEYLETGRCEKLDGIDGTYHLYETEIRSNLVVPNIDNVMESLDSIKNSQYKTYSLLTDIKYNTSNTASKIDSFVKFILENDMSQDVSENDDYKSYKNIQIVQNNKFNYDMNCALKYFETLTK